jgi:multidrug efflux pump subunit AcrA (membrane-fusion protein)
MKIKTGWLIVVIVVVVGAAAAAAVAALRGIGGLAEYSDVPTYEVERGDFVRRIYAEGNLEAAQATYLSPPASVRGPLRIAWLAPDGSNVKAGDVVVRFDPTELEDKLTNGRNDRAKADTRIVQKQVTEEKTIRDLDRDAGVAEMDLSYAREFQSKDPEIFSRIEIIESEIDESLATSKKEHADAMRVIRQDLGKVEMDLLDLERHKAEIQIDQAERELAELELTAPHDGIFVLKEVWGDMPQVGSVVWGGNRVAEIPQMDVMDAKVYVLEADAGGLEVGVPATVVLDACPGRVYQAKVKKVDALAQPRNRHVPVQYFGVVLELEKTETEIMKPGQRMQAVLTLDERDDVISIPRQAVFSKEGKSVAYVRRIGGFEPVEVTKGPAGLGLVVIEKGLQEGDVIALRDPTRPLREPAADEGEAENGMAAPKAGGAP